MIIHHTHTHTHTPLSLRLSQCSSKRSDFVPWSDVEANSSNFASRKLAARVGVGVIFPRRCALRLTPKKLRLSSYLLQQKKTQEMLSLPALDVSWKQAADFFPFFSSVVSKMGRMGYRLQGGEEEEEEEKE